MNGSQVASPRVTRPRSLQRVVTEHDLNKHYTATPEPPLTNTFQEAFSASVRSFDVRQWIRDRFPFLSALKGYDRQGMARDLLTGITVSVILIPQALAHTALAGMPVSYSLYIAFVPLIVYTFIGSCRELSVGSFALISLVVAQTVPKLIDNYDAIAATDTVKAEELYVSTAMGLTLVVGLILLGMSLLRLGWVISFFSKPAISALLVSSAYVICTSQIGTLLQIKIKSDSSFVQSWGIVFRDIGTANPVTSVTGILSIVIILLLDHLAKPPRLRNPPPIALFVVILATTVSHLAEFHDKYKVNIVGKLNDTFPTPTVPAVGSWMTYIEAALPLAVIAFVLTMSQVKQFAAENGYTASANQELFALGVMNIVSSFFSAYVPASSLARSVVANKIKPRSQLWALVSVAIIAVCIGGLAPLLHDLPSSVLAAIIIAAFKTLLMQITEPLRLWKVSKREALIWVLVFLTAMLLTTQWAIVTALALSVGSLISDISRPNFSFLGRLGDSKIYRDTTRYPAARTPPEVIVFRFDAHLHFANHEFFGEALSLGIARKLEAQEEEQMEWALRDNPDQNVTLEVVSPRLKRRDGTASAPSASPVTLGPPGRPASAASAGAASSDVAIEIGVPSLVSPSRADTGFALSGADAESEISAANDESPCSASDEEGSDEDGVMLRVRVDNTVGAPDYRPRPWGRTSSARVPGPASPKSAASFGRREIGGRDQAERKTGPAGRQATGTSDEVSCDEVIAGHGERPGAGPAHSEDGARDLEERHDVGTDDEIGTTSQLASPSTAPSIAGSERRPQRDGWSSLPREMRVRWKRELNPKLRLAVVISAYGINGVDSSSMETLRKLSEREDLLLLFVGLKASIRSMLVKHSGILHVQYAMFHDLHDAVVFGRACVLHQRKIREREAAAAEESAEHADSAGHPDHATAPETELSRLSVAPESTDDH